jgi:hypothetical protein
MTISPPPTQACSQLHRTSAADVRNSRSGSTFSPGRRLECPVPGVDRTSSRGASPTGKRRSQQEAEGGRALGSMALTGHPLFADICGVSREDWCAPMGDRVFMDPCSARHPWREPQSRPFQLRAARLHCGERWRFLTTAAPQKSPCSSCLAPGLRTATGTRRLGQLPTS